MGPSSWFQGNGSIFPAHEGEPDAYIAANYESVDDVGTISNWLITPEVTIVNGATVTFWTRKAELFGEFANRIEVRMSAAGASTDLGDTAESVGDFTEVLLTINPDLIPGEYPQEWTQFTLTVRERSRKPVTVTVDSTDLEVGEYTAQLCVTTNDPNAPQVPVPVTLTVVEGDAASAFDVNRHSLSGTWESLQKEETMSAKKASQKSAKSTTAISKKSKGFTDEERAAMKERARELKAEARANKDKAGGESAVLAKIAEMTEPDRAMAKRLHAIIKASAPALAPKTWYGMPAYAKDGKVVCFFQSAQKFKSRYATFGFSDEANLDKGAMWPTSFALKELTAAEEAKIGALVKKAVS